MFEQTVALGADPKLASNYLMVDVNAYLNKVQQELKETALTAEGLAGMIKLITDGTISSKYAKKVFADLLNMVEMLHNR